MICGRALPSPLHILGALVENQLAVYVHGLICEWYVPALTAIAVRLDLRQFCRASEEWLTTPRA